MILAGCSGWSYSDWVDRFYPRELAQRHSEWLRYYAGFFRTTEVNSTFYSMPSRGMVDAWIEKVKDIGKFEFSVKMPKTITHDKLPAGDIDGIRTDFESFENSCIIPLLDAGRLGAVLLQLPPQFGYSPENTQLLGRMFNSVDNSRVQYAVEFRNRSWLDRGGDELRREALELLSSNEFCAVIVDSPAFPATATLTSTHAYLRFHGRNSDIWYGGADEQDMRINRYDYLYSRGQLEQWAPRLRAVEERVVDTRIYFNNHGRAKAAKNALEMMDLLGVEHVQKQIHIMDQARLGHFME